MAVKFNLTSIPKSAKITKAELGLYAYGIASGTSTTLKNGSKSVYKISGTWTETSIKWNAVPNASNTALASCSNTKTNDWDLFDVTSDVKDIIEKESANNGYLVRFPSTSYGVKYRSSEFQSSGNRPKLTITYELSDPVAPQVTVKAPGSGEVLKQGQTYTIQWTATDNVGVVSCAIYFSSDNGSTWTKVDSAAGNTGTFQWTVPAVVLSDYCQIKVNAYDSVGNGGTGKSSVFSVKSMIGILPQWKVPVAESYQVTVTTVQGRKVVSFVVSDLRLIDQKIAMLPSGVHVVHVATQDTKFMRKIRFVQ